MGRGKRGVPGGCPVRRRPQGSPGYGTRRPIIPATYGVRRTSRPHYAYYSLLLSTPSERTRRPPPEVRPEGPGLRNLEKPSLRNLKIKALAGVEGPWREAAGTVGEPPLYCPEGRGVKEGKRGMDGESSNDELASLSSREGSSEKGR